MSMNSIYEEYKESPLWEKIKKSLGELEKNQDISMTTDMDYVVGYIVKELSK